MTSRCPECGAPEDRRTRYYCGYTPATLPDQPPQAECTRSIAYRHKALKALQGQLRTMIADNSDVDEITKTTLIAAISRIAG